MKLRLKNRSLQAELDHLSGGDFSRRLDEWNGDLTEEFIVLQFGRPTGNKDFPRVFEVCFLTDALEEVQPYRPDQWNVWPDVEPPDDVPMQVEIHGRLDNGEIHKMPRFIGSGMFFCGRWINLRQIDDDEFVLFRPWVGPDKETLERKNHD